MIDVSNKHEDIQKVAIYTRVSTEDQAHEGYSLDSQLNRLKDYCKAREWKIVDIFTDDGYSGRNIKRPGYTQMMGSISSWDAILVIKMDRIHRNSKNFMVMMEELWKHNKEFISMQESLDTSTAMGRFVMKIIQDIAQLESEQIGERVFSSLCHKMEKTDKIMGHKFPFGYEWIPGKTKDDPGEIIPIPERLDIVKEVFDLYINGKVKDPVIKTSKGYINRITSKKIKKRNVNRVIQEYNKNGHSHSSIGHELGLSKSTVRYYLNNIFYAGYERWCHFFRKINNGFEPIIDRDTWNKAQIKMRTTSKTHDYKPMEIPEDFPEYWSLDKTDRKQIPIIMRAKHNFNF